MRIRPSTMTLAAMMVSATVSAAGDAHQLPPYSRSVVFEAGEITEGTVPRSRLRDLCGDGDGCRLGLLLEAVEGSTVVNRFSQWSFATNGTGRHWSVDNGNGTFVEGTIDDSTILTIVVIDSSPGWCNLQETGGPPSTYVVTATGEADLDTGLCTLRVDD